MENRNNITTITVNPRESVEVISEQLLTNEKYNDIISALNKENELAYAIFYTNLANNAAKIGNIEKQNNLFKHISEPYIEAAHAFISKSAACREYYNNNGVGAFPGTPTFDIFVNEGKEQEVVAVYLNEGYGALSHKEDLSL